LTREAQTGGVLRVKNPGWCNITYGRQGQSHATHEVAHWSRLARRWQRAFSLQSCTVCIRRPGRDWGERPNPKCEKMNKNKKCDILSLLVLAHHHRLEGGEFAWRGRWGRKSGCFGLFNDMHISRVMETYLSGSGKIGVSEIVEGHCRSGRKWSSHCWSRTKRRDGRAMIKIGLPRTVLRGGREGSDQAPLSRE